MRSFRKSSCKCQCPCVNKRWSNRLRFLDSQRRQCPSCPEWDPAIATQPRCWCITSGRKLFSSQSHLMFHKLNCCSLMPIHSQLSQWCMMHESLWFVIMTISGKRSFCDLRFHLLTSLGICDSGCLLLVVFVILSTTEAFVIQGTWRPDVWLLHSIQIQEAIKMTPRRFRILSRSSRIQIKRRSVTF